MSVECYDVYQLLFYYPDLYTCRGGQMGVRVHLIQRADNFL